MLYDAHCVIQFIGQSFCILDHLEIQVNDKVALVKKTLVIQIENRMVAFCSKVTERFSALYYTTFHWKFECPKGCDLFDHPRSKCNLWN